MYTIDYGSNECCICGTEFTVDNPVWDSEETFSTAQNGLDHETHVDGICKNCRAVENAKAEVVRWSGENVLSVDPMQQGPIEVVFDEQTTHIELLGVKGEN